MKLHGNARTCPKSRRLLVERVLVEGWSVMAAAAAAGVSERTVWRWLARFRAEGESGLPRSLVAAAAVAAPAAGGEGGCDRSLRGLRMTAAQIAEILALALSTVSAWLLKRMGSAALPARRARAAAQSL